MENERFKPQMLTELVKQLEKEGLNIKEIRRLANENECEACRFGGEYMLAKVSFVASFAMIGTLAGCAAYNLLTSACEMPQNPSLILSSLLGFGVGLGIHTLSYSKNILERQNKNFYKFLTEYRTKMANKP